MAHRRHWPKSDATPDLAAALTCDRSTWFPIVIFSVFANLLLLTGPIFMLQVYDRVLSSRSDATLTALFVLVAFLYLVMGLLDYARQRLTNGLGATFQARMDDRVFDAVLRHASRFKRTGVPRAGVKEVEAIRRFLASPALLALIDLPWAPLFTAAIFVFHPLLGWVALGGGSVLVFLALLGQFASRGLTEKTAVASTMADRIANHAREQSETLEALGMRRAILIKWHAWRDHALAAQLKSASQTGSLKTISKTFRFFLQSAILAVGAYLVLRDELTAGAMIASSILMGRALAPVEQAVSGWSVIQSARRAWVELNAFLTEIPVETKVTELPAPRASIEVDRATIIPPGDSIATLHHISFKIQPGQVLGVIGPSASGKSSLARALTGLWRPVSGTIRLDGSSLDQFESAVRASHIGYLPQDVVLFEASIAENISRLAPPDENMVIEAAQSAGAHEMIKTLPEGYNTRLGPGGEGLSGGQRQRIALARALYGDPAVLVLDEPDSNLDGFGTEALNATIRAMKARARSVVIMTHRPAAISECDLVMILDQGRIKSLGPRDAVLKAELKNHNSIAANIADRGARVK